MNPELKQRLLQNVHKSIAESLQMTSRRRNDRNGMEGRMQTRYSNHLREQATLDLSIAEDILDQQKSLAKELANAGPCTQVSMGAYIEVTFSGDDTPEHFVFLSTQGNLREKGFNIMTPKSPLGEVLQGKRAGDVFTYNIAGSVVNGVLTKVE